ncbi:hypothetical protein Tco_1105213 [Tanacetum coccineum]
MGMVPVSITTNNQYKLRFCLLESADELYQRKREKSKTTCLFKALPEEHLLSPIRRQMPKKCGMPSNSEIWWKMTNPRNCKSINLKQQFEGFSYPNPEWTSQRLYSVPKSSNHLEIHEQEAQKEKEDLKAKEEKWRKILQNLSKLLNTQMIANEIVWALDSQPTVWSEAHIIEEYQSDSDDECVSIPTKQQETPSFANQQVKSPRENAKSQNTHSQKPKGCIRRDLRPTVDEISRLNGVPVALENFSISSLFVSQILTKEQGCLQTLKSLFFLPEIKLPDENQVLLKIPRQTT